MQGEELRFSFTGKGGEYFVIWIVNLILTILTLGIYSAWAKVRRMQYFYRNTHLADSSFDYHGNPVAILKGRLIGVGLFVGYSVFWEIMPLVGMLILLLIYAVMPYLLLLSFRFRLYYSSYRGLRFSFKGSVENAYVVFLALPFAAMATLFIMTPYAHQQIKAYQHNNSRFGQSAFSFNASSGSFYKIYFFAFLQYILVVSLFIYGLYQLMNGNFSDLSKEDIGLAVAGVFALFMFMTLLIIPYFQARIQNLVWNNTVLGEHRFSSSMTVLGLAWVIFTNFLFIVITLGLFKPFADIRLARYTIEHMALFPAGSLDEFIASEQQKIGATGSETAEIFDVDIGL